MNRETLWLTEEREREAGSTLTEQAQSEQQQGLVDAAKRRPWEGRSQMHEKVERVEKVERQGLCYRLAPSNAR